MKHNVPQQTGKNARWSNKDSATSTASELRASAAFLRELLQDVDGIAARMDAHRMGSITIPGGNGAAALDRAEGAIKAWANGVKKAFLDRIKHPQPGDDVAGAEVDE